MKPEIQNRINEVKYECGMDIFTLKKVNGIEKSLKLAKRGLFSRLIRYVGIYFISLIIMMMAVASGLEKNITGYTPIDFHGAKKIYSHDPVEQKRIMIEKSNVQTFLYLTPGLIVILYFELLVYAPRRRQLKKMGEEGFLKAYAIANGLPQDLFEVRSK